jgi:hypothetical protein
MLYLAPGNRIASYRYLKGINTKEDLGWYSTNKLEVVQ